MTENFYDSKGNLIRTQNPDGTITTRGYEAGQLTSEVDPLGNPTSHSYDFFSGGHLTSTTDALGHATTFTNTPMGLRRTEARTRTLPGGGQQTLTTTFFYDGEGRVTSTVSPDGERVRTEFNALGQEAARIDQRGNRTEMTYDDQGRLVATTYAVGSPNQAVERTEYDLEGRRTASVDRAGRRTEYRYDSLGRLVRTTFADGKFSTSEFDSAGRVAASVDVTGARTEFGYDSAGRRIFTRDAAGRVSSFGFDAAGNLVAETDPVGRITFHHFDALNRETATIFPDGTMRFTSYDSAGRRVALVDQAGERQEFRLDALGRLTHEIDAMGNEKEFTFDEVGGTTAFEDKTNDRIVFEQDQMGRRTLARLPGGQEYRWTYDAAGNEKTRTDPRGFVTTYDYDELNRLTRTTFDPTSGEPAIVRTYTATGRPFTITRGTWVETYEYDLRDRRTKKIMPLDTLEYSYDGGGRLSTITSTKAGLLVTYRYDVLNRLEEAEDGQGRITRYVYNLAGNLVEERRPNGVTITRSYDSLNRLELIEATGPSGVLARFDYTLDAEGTRTGVSEVGGSRTWTYDPDDRLTSERITDPDLPSGGGQLVYGLDADGNRTQLVSGVTGISNQSNTLNGNDELASEAYDLNGNATSAAGHTYTYSARNELLTVDGGAVKYGYDPQGLRISKESAGTTTWYLWDELSPTGFPQVLVEYTGATPAAAAPSRTYAFGHGRISQREAASGQTSFFIWDGIGTTRLLTDEGGHEAGAFTYDAFGVLLARTGSRTTDHLFAGEHFDADADLVYLRARWLDPANGRFLGRDPIFFDQMGRENAFLYASHDPVNRVDPTGKFSLAQVMTTMQMQNVLNNFFINLQGFQPFLRANEFNDQISLERINTLQPGLRRIARRHMQLGKNRGYIVRVTEAYRTFAQQAALHAANPQGAAPAGQSLHNYGIAYDIAVFNGPGYTNPVWLGSDPRYSDMGAIGQGINLVWGGDFGDWDHFSIDVGYGPETNGGTWRPLKERFGDQTPVPEFFF